MKQMKNKFIKKEEGSGLVLALMVLLVLSALGSTLGVVTVGSHRLADINRDSTSAYYIAEAGANMAYEEVVSKIIDTHKKHTISQNYFNEIPKLSNKSYDEFSIQSNSKPTANIIIEGPVGSGNERNYTILSTGKVGNMSRQVKKPMTIKWIENKSSSNLKTPPKNLALAYTNKFNVGDDFKAIGDILYTSNADDPKGVRFIQEEGTISISDNIIDYQKSVKDNLLKIIKSLPTHNVSFNSLPSNGNIQYPHDKKVSSNVLTSNGTVTLLDRVVINGDIITSNGDIEIGSNAIVTGDIITSNGKVTLFDRAVVNGNIFTENGEVVLNSQAIVKKKVISKNGSVTLKNHAQVYEEIITENSHINIGSDSHRIGAVITNSGHVTFGGNLKVFGNIITGNGNISFANGVEVNGAVITGNGVVSSGTDLKVFGTMIASSIDSNARMQVKYINDYIEKFPFTNSDIGVKTEPNITNLITSQPAIEQ